MAILKSKTEDRKKESATSAGASSIKVPTVLIQPRISEKSGKLSAMNKYVFTIKRDSNKVEVKKAIESAYKVHVIQVNIITNAGKARNFGKTTGRTQGFKKAIVTLKKGDKIEGFDTI